MAAFAPERSAQPLQYALDLIDLVFNPGDTLLMELAGLFELLGQLDPPLLVSSYGVGVEKVATVPAHGGVDVSLANSSGSIRDALESISPGSIRGPRSRTF